MEAAVEMNPIAGMQSRRLLSFEAEQISQRRPRRSLMPHRHGIDVVDVGKRRPTQDTRPRRGPIDDELPLLRQVVRTEPVHVIEQRESGDAGLGSSKMVGHPGGVDGEPIEQPRLELRESGRLQILRTACRTERAKDIDAHEVIRCERNVMHQLLDDGQCTLMRPAGEVEDRLALPFRDSHQHERQSVRPESGDAARPKPFAQAGLIEMPLFLETASREQLLERLPQPFPMLPVADDEPHHQAPAAVIVETGPRTLAAEVVEMPVPVATGLERQPMAYRVVVHLPGAQCPTDAEQLPEFRMLQPTDGGRLEFEQSSLTRVAVDRLDRAGSREQIIESVAAAAGDDEDAIGRAEFKRLAVESRVFPASVVDEVALLKRR